MKKLRLNLIFAVLLSSHLPALAQSAARDLFQTLPGASIDLSTLNLGIVTLQGVSISPSACNSSFVIERAATTPAAKGPVPVTVFALFLKSANAVTYLGQSADLYITLNNSGGAISTSSLPQPDSLAPSSGSMTPRSDGAFELNITVNADLIYVKPGTSVSNSSNYLGHQAAPSVTLKWEKVRWSSTPPAGYPQNSYLRSGGSYPSGVSESQGPVMHLKIAPAQCGSTA